MHNKKWTEIEKEREERESTIILLFIVLSNFVNYLKRKVGFKLFSQEIYEWYYIIGNTDFLLYALKTSFLPSLR